jgi:hypothetical protein
MPEPSKIHKTILKNLQEQHPEFKTDGFWKTIRKYTRDSEYSARTYNFIPDGFILLEKEQVLLLFEVVDFNDITKNKMVKIFAFADYIGDTLEVAVIRLDKHGNRNALSMDVMKDYYFQWLEDSLK